MIYYGGYVSKDDAIEQSNYKEWKKTYNIITDVDIKVETTGISENDLFDLNDCLARKDFFFMSGIDGMLLVSPVHLAIKKGDEIFTYVTFKQLVNAIKLMLFNYNKIYTIEKVETMIEQKYENKVVKITKEDKEEDSKKETWASIEVCDKSPKLVKIEFDSLSPCKEEDK